jgi:hypothetical protein
MSWFHGKTDGADNRDHASVSEVLACFLDQRTFLLRLALLITGDERTADQSVVDACDMAVEGHGPFRDWLFEWAKAVTITSAISRCGAAIRSCETAYRDRRCSHADHLQQGNLAERESSLNFILQTDPGTVIAELDALSRALLVLRVAIRSSIQDCVVRLNVSRAAVLAANCRAMTWLHDLRLKSQCDQASSVKPQPDNPRQRASPEERREARTDAGKRPGSSPERQEEL